MNSFIRIFSIGLMLACGVFAKPVLAADRPIIVFAAASLKDSLETIGKAYTAAGGAEVKFSFAASSILAKQIEAGTIADLFASADTKWMDYVEDRGLILRSSRLNLLGNRLVVVAAANAPLSTLDFTPQAFLATLGDGRLATGDVTAVPIGFYAKSALQSLGLWAALEPKLAQADNVRSALAFVARGEAPLGIVYATDAQIEKNVKIIAEFPASSHDAIVYPFALTTASTHPEGQKFFAFLKSPAAHTLFAAAGFPVLIP